VGRSYQTKSRGAAVLNSPVLNKGTAFTATERKALGLTGLLPPEISTLGAQVKLAYIQYDRLPDTLSKNNYLTTLRARNEVLFYRLFSEHLREMMPVLDDVTLSLAAQRNHHECGPSRGVYLSIDHVDAMEEAFANLGAGAADIDLILTTDGEQVPGIGDGGMSGIERSIGKLAVYTAAGGIDPNRAIPVMLDVGTDRQDLLNDPTYLGNRHPRIRGERYDAFLDGYVKTLTRLFPNALLH
jgi:malate dehydrogenase (oxaloacetate-decarboxylating)